VEKPSRPWLERETEDLMKEIRSLVEGLSFR